MVARHAIKTMSGMPREMAAEHLATKHTSGTQFDGTVLGSMARARLHHSDITVTRGVQTRKAATNSASSPSQKQKRARKEASSPSVEGELGRRVEEEVCVLMQLTRAHNLTLMTSPPPTHDITTAQS
jgi:hypothetical protein